MRGRGFATARFDELLVGLLRMVAPRMVSAVGLQDLVIRVAYDEVLWRELGRSAPPLRVVGTPSTPEPSSLMGPLT